MSTLETTNFHLSSISHERNADSDAYLVQSDFTLVLEGEVTEQSPHFSLTYGIGALIVRIGCVPHQLLAGPSGAHCLHISRKHPPVLRSVHDSVIGLGNVLLSYGTNESAERLHRLWLEGGLSDEDWRAVNRDKL